MVLGCGLVDVCDARVTGCSVDTGFTHGGDVGCGCCVV